MAFAIKAEIRDLEAKQLDFAAQKTMYGGKHVAVGDTIYLFASENQGGHGLVARGVATQAEAIAIRPGIERQTPLVSVSVAVTGRARLPLGRRELRFHAKSNDSQPATELNFKFYRQATNKIVGISDPAAQYLNGFF